MSLNVKGLSKPLKRRKAFRLFHKQNVDVNFLQKTFSSVTNIQVWENEWGGKLYSNHGTNHSRGVAVLFNPKLDFTVESYTRDRNGRIIILSIVLDKEKFVLANIYSPNNQNAQLSFYNNVFSLLQPYANENKILSDDFNCCMTNKDKYGGKPVTVKQPVISQIENLAKSFNLVDTWRKKYPNRQEFTWRNTNLKVSCRLDYFFASSSLVNEFTKCNISETTISPDHSMISLSLLSAQSAQKRGPSFWKFNNSLLQDENFIESLEQKLPEFKNKYADLNDKGLLWEMVKMEIRAFSISFSKYKASQKRKEEKQLLQQLNKLQRELALGFSKTTHNLFITVKEKLDKIISTKTKGCIIRSKCRWYERGERSNKYFFNLTKRNYNRKHITSIKTDKNETITNPKEILNQQRKYYEDLYKENEK